jgi:hypothetical protein
VGDPAQRRLDGNDDDARVDAVRSCAPRVVADERERLDHRCDDADDDDDRVDAVRVDAVRALLPLTTAAGPS